MIINRDKYLNQLIRKKWNGLIKIITGIRRCGKSYLLFELYHAYLNSIGVDDNWVKGNRNGQGTSYYQYEKKTDLKCMKAASLTASITVREFFMISFSMRNTPANISYY